jgi:hypothetical protein
MDASTSELISTRSTLRPQFIYSCQINSNKLYRANTLTGKQTWLKIPAYQFKFGCRWSELPGRSLLITGGYPAVREVVKIDTLRECAVSSLPPMHTARHSHAAVYHSQYLYVLGCKKCERYVCAESRWEVLPALPEAGCDMSAVELKNSLYALGGIAYGRHLDTVQKMRLDSFTWELLQLKLPQAAFNFPCFKTDTQVYLVIDATLYSFSPPRVKPIKTVPESSESNTSYYYRGTLYFEAGGGIETLAIGGLNSL